MHPLNPALRAHCFRRITRVAYLRAWQWVCVSECGRAAGLVNVGDFQEAQSETVVSRQGPARGGGSDEERASKSSDGGIGSGSSGRDADEEEQEEVDDGADVDVRSGAGHVIMVSASKACVVACHYTPCMHRAR